MAKHPWKGRGQVTWTIEILVDSGYANHISGTAEARVTKLCKRVSDIKFQHTADKSPLKGPWSGSRDLF